MGKLWKKLRKKIGGKSENYVISDIVDIGGDESHRFHLRFLKDGRGLLNIDAKHIIYLNSTAREYVDLMIKGHSDDDITNFFLKRYNGVNIDDIRSDLTVIKKKLFMLLSEEGHCPIHDIGLRPMARNEDLGFPLRVDLAVTYNCNNRCEHCYVPANILNNFPVELNTEGIKKIMDKLWDIGVPHIALTGGEASLRLDILELIEYGQYKGFVMGIITNGRMFSNKKFVEEAVHRGLDYAQITIESHIPEIHDAMQCVDGAWQETTAAIKNFVESGIFTLTNTTISKANVQDIEKTVEFLKELGLEAFAMNGLIYSGKGVELQRNSDVFLQESELEPLLDGIYSKADELGLRFIWYTPTQYCVFNPMEMGLGAKRCSAASASMGIQPNGDVIPCQSYFEPVGNILDDDWDEIWNSKLFKKIRGHQLIEKKCQKCEMLDLCGGGCPLYISEKRHNIGHVVPL